MRGLSFKALAVFTLGVFAAQTASAVDIQKVTSPGGIKAWLVEDASIPFVALEVRFEGGASMDRPGKRGAVNLMTALLEEGSGDLDARGFATASESVAAQFRYNVGDDTLSVSARFLTEKADESIALLRDSLVDPTFPNEDLERVRAQVLAGIESDAKDPNAIASLRFDEVLYGDHPYGSSIDGTEGSVTALAREDILLAHRDALVKDRVYVGAAGDISAADLGLLLDTLLGDLPVSERPLPDDVDVQTHAGVEIVDFDTPQSVALFGHKGITRDDPDFFAAYVLNQILGGGGFEARLMTEVREKRGLTYGVYSYLSPKSHAEVYLGSVASANDRIAEAIDVIRAEWAKAAIAGVTETELEAAKTYLTGAYPLRFDSNAAIARILVGMQLDHLTPDYITSRNAKIDALTVADIKRVAARILRPEELLFVVVGQPVGLETQ